MTVRIEPRLIMPMGRRSAGFTGGREPAYDAAGSGRRNSGWNATAESLNSIIMGAAETLRAKSRDMGRKNPWIHQGLNRWKSNAIGTGIVPIPMHPNRSVRRKLTSLFRRWTDESDAHGVTDFYGQQMLAASGVKEAGEAFCRFRPRSLKDNLSVPLQLQLIAGDHVPFERTGLAPNGNRVRMGIEFDDIGRRSAYHMWREHPGDVRTFTSVNDIIRVPAPEICHIFEPLEIGQIRGVSGMATVLLKARDFDLYEGGEIVRKRDNAQRAGFITETSGQGGAGFGGETTKSAIDSVVDTVILEAGTWQKLRPGEDVKPATPAEMGTGYNDFMRWVLRAIAAGLGITYEQLTGDLTGVNYSSIRAGLLEFRRAIEQWQHSVFIFQFCRPVWNRWLRSALISGALEISALDFERERHLYEFVEWRPQGWQWVDPEKEIRAIVKAIRSGLMSREQAVAGYGYSAEEIDTAIAAEIKRTDKLGVSYDSDGRRPEAGSGQQSSSTGMGHNGGPKLDDDESEDDSGPDDEDDSEEDAR
jgi:lambda family phage portal protein